MRLILSRLLWHFDVISFDGLNQWSPEGEMKFMGAYSRWEKPEFECHLATREKMTLRLD